MINNSVPRVTVWHHSAEPLDAKLRPLGQIFLSVPHTHVRFLLSVLLMYHVPSLVGPHQVPTINFNRGE